MPRARPFFAVVWRDPPNLPRASLPVVEEPLWRPRTRGDCLPGGRNEVRPCPYAGCRHNLMIDVDRAGKITVYANSPDSLPETCSLDVADRVDDVGRNVVFEELEPYFGITRERIRQLELRALERFARRLGRSSTLEVGGGVESMLRGLGRQPRQQKPRKSGD